MFNLTGKVALVTGASSGIGRAAVVALASQGAKVAACARRFDRLTALSDEMRNAGHEVLPIQMDVTKKADIDAAVSKTVSTFGRLDILVNNAGVLDFAPFIEMTEASWDKVIDTNVKGYFFASQAAAREMAKNKWGRIINIASIASGGVGIGYAMIVHYCASKGAIVGMTEAMATELAPMGILVNAIGPGAIETEMTAGMLKDPKQAEALVSRAPLKRAGKPEEIASMIAYMASDESSYMTGATVYIDGGWLAA